MADQIIKARVWQKIDTEANWNNNPLVLGPGEAAFVVTPGGLPVNFKLGDGTKRFSQLPWYFDWGAQAGVPKEANTTTAFPPGDPGLYIPTEDGTYNPGGVVVDLSEGVTQLIWDGSTLTKVVFPIGLANGDVTEGDIRSVSGDKVWQSQTIVIKEGKKLIPTTPTTPNGYYYWADGVFTPNAGYSSLELLNVIPGEKLYITGSTRSTETSLIHTYNLAGGHIGHIMRGTGARVDFTDYEFVVPAGVYKIGVTTIDLTEVNIKGVHPESRSYYKEEADTIFRRISDSYSKSEVYSKNESDNLFDILLVDGKLTIPVTIRTPNGYYYWADGVFTTSDGSGYLSCELIEVTPGEKLYITGTIRSTQTSLIHTFSASSAHVGYVLRGDGDTQDFTDYEFVVPAGVYKIGVTTPVNGLPIAVKRADKESKSYTKQESDSKYATKEYGLRWNITDVNDEGSRVLDAVGLSATIGIGASTGVSDFDAIFPWSDIKRCNIKKNSAGANIITWEEEAAFSLNGSNGDVFVRIPKFKVDKYRQGGYEYRVITNKGFVHPAFIENGVELDEIFISAFEAAESAGVLTSVADNMPKSNLFPQQYLDKATAKGRGYTLYDNRTNDMLYYLISIEFGKRNTNRIFGYGVADYLQPVSSYSSLDIATGNTIRVNKFSQASKARVGAGTNIVICQGTQSNIIAERKVTGVTEDSTSTSVTFDGSAISMDNNTFFGSGAQDTNWCATCEVPLTHHTGRANRSAPPLSNNLINPMRYRWIENVFGNIWHYLPDVTFSAGQMYVCDNIEDYEMFKKTAPYRPVGGIFPAQMDNGDSGDVTGANYWITDLTQQHFAKSVQFGGPYDKALRSTNAFGSYYYMSHGDVIIVHGGGYDHVYRCNLLTFRAWVTETTQWYLYGARLQFKNI